MVYYLTYRSADEGGRHEFVHLHVCYRLYPHRFPHQIRHSQAKRDGRGSASVSYTHLDVYKRQLC